jgi:hypothetical protein
MKKLKRESQQNPQDLESGGLQIVSGPIFSDSLYKNRLVANFPALEDQF